MKKLAYPILIVMMIVTVCSCSKINSAIQSAQDVPELTSLPYSELAAKFTVSNYTEQSEEMPFQTIEFTEAGRYFLIKTFSDNSTKAAEERNVLVNSVKSGTYAYQDGVYSLDTGESVMVRSTSEIIFTDALKNDFTLSVKEEVKIGETEFVGQIARSWIPVRTVVSVSGEKGRVELARNGFNLHEILQYISANGYEVDYDSFQGYDVSFVTLTKSKTFAFEFKSNPPSPFMGSFTVMNDGLLIYSTKDRLNDYTFTKSVTGKVFFKEGFLVIQLNNVEFVKEDQTVLVSVEMRLKEG